MRVLGCIKRLTGANRKQDAGRSKQGAILKSGEASLVNFRQALLVSCACVALGTAPVFAQEDAADPLDFLTEEAPAEATAEAAPADEPATADEPAAQPAVQAETETSSEPEAASDAQLDAAALEPPRERSGPRVDEIFVTAEKREESLQDVPVSIVALPKEQLEYRGIDELKDFANNIPNVSVNQFTGSADTIRLFIRGLGQNSVEPTQDPSVALYIDGVYIGSSFGTGFELVDLERVEVLRGPQGTLYGRNATGGAINMITARPTPGEWGFSQSFTVGNFDAFKSKTNVNIPVGQSAGIKLSFLRSARDGFVENIGQGPDFGLEDRLGARFDFTWDVNNDFRVDIAADYSIIKDSAPYEQGRGGPGANGSFTGPALDPVGLNLGPIFLPLVQPLGSYNYVDPVRQERNDEGTALRPYKTGDNDVAGAALTLTWDINSGLTAKSITGFRYVDRSNFGDFAPYADASIAITLPGPVGQALTNLGLSIPVPLGGGPIADQADVTKIHQFSQEIQFLGDTELWGQPFRYVAGVYYYQDDIFQDATNSTTLEGPRNLDQTNAQNKAAAIFAQLTYTPGWFEDRLHLTLGGRGSWDDRYAKRINENSFGFAAVGGFTPQNCQTFSLLIQFISTNTPCVPTGTVEPSFYEGTFYNFNPSGTIEFDINDVTNIYAKVVTGYKTGGTATRSANPENFGEGFDPEELISYELGLKGQFMDQRLQINSAAFFMQIDGFQTSIQTGATPGDRDFIGLDGTKIAGFETDIVFAITEWLFFRGSYGYLYTKLGQTEVTTRVDSGELVTFELIDELSFAPRQSFSLTFDAFLPLNSWLDMAAYVAYNFKGAQQGSINKDDNAEVGSSGTVDLNVSFITSRIWGGGDQQLKVNLFVKNLFDLEYEVTGLSAFKFAGLDETGVYGPPRTFGLTATYDF